MPALPTIFTNNAPYQWAPLADANGLPITAANPLPATLGTANSNVNVAQIGGIATRMYAADGVAGTSVLESGIAIWNGATADRVQSPYGAGVSNATNGVISAGTYYFNNSTFDMVRNNLDVGAIITATAVTTTQMSSNQFNLNGRGVKVVLNMTTVGTGSVTLHIQGLDSGGSVFYDQLVGSAVTTNSTNVYTVYPGIAVVANATASDVVPRTWRVQVVANNANATSYSVSAVTLL